eukprot:CAMPEP_0113723452 /NCGR_PEP_ID=MMETSP0038_2-20120614/38431_1 /TAXON_ID=2898 /ORGANISM="Cryptomonas paramecium" /LENGTH=176 /DNA_ID=CAMNT_0000653043 /DNA_START=14 /DNA_END=540 /DNA_ORIENTATION=+ /assembly_acc=CAM_ASM_000170
MRTSCLVLLTACIGLMLPSALAQRIEEEQKIDESHVVVLDGSNLSDAIASNKFLLVEFYAPWCGHCKNLVPVYAEAAKALASSEPRVTLAKLDGTQNEAVMKSYNIQGFPTLKWFVDGQLMTDSPMERTAPGITRWCQKRSAGAAPVVRDAAALTQRIETSRVLAVAFVAAAEGPT